ncbi:CapA family protein [Methylocapsa polymorpha]|uniref:CapA family protein n=1 Tax=Methylocapsa polymorpha TaxID=3080828 RepID=A0ABZ0HTJ3_9HYPH|nr:CapA family protein [Methylocapsa sp. RX1]
MSFSALSIPDRPAASPIIRVFLCGDVMTGRGVDQILPHPCDPCLHEGYIRSAKDYVRLAEQASGPIPAPAHASYIWGAALDEWRRAPPDARIVNLETSITHSDAYVEKGINYRMSPENAERLLAARLDCCVLGNNHVLDWGRAGLLETLDVLERLGIKTAGAGRDLAQASAPAVIEIADKGRVLVFSFASPTSGVPWEWAATKQAAGVNLLPDFTDESVARIAKLMASVRRPGDVVIASIHWGPNWGYEIPQEQRRFARALIDRAHVSIVHGHSSHHAKAIEIYKDRLILYGCGDFLNDYEGIRGYEEFRGDLAVMYLASFEPSTERLAALELIPLQIRRFQLVPASSADVEWMRRILDRESSALNVSVNLAHDGRLTLRRRDVVN